MSRKKDVALRCSVLTEARGGVQWQGGSETDWYSTPGTLSCHPGASSQRYPELLTIRTVGEGTGLSLQLSYH